MSNLSINLPTNQKYILFLHPRYFKNSIFKSIYKKIKKNLENKGVVVFNINNAITELHKLENKTDKQKSDKNKKDSGSDKTNNNDIKKNTLSFDDTPYPNVNMLYIHLFNGQYYNDSIYNKKKIDIEREMLILLAGKLGVHKISYEISTSDVTISHAEATVSVKGNKNGINFKKEISNSKEISGKEEYINRGAPTYVGSKDIEAVEENIKQNLGSMESNVFNYDFYKHNQKLESFVYKRFEFKMSKLEYIIDTEDISDFSFFVKSCFTQFGINISFDKLVTTSQSIKYTLEFFSDKVLKMEYFTTKKCYSDEFFTIREQYDSIKDKNLAVQYITEYVTKLCKKCFYKVRDGCGMTYDYSKRLSDFIKNTPDGTFETIAHHFRSTLQIKNWIYKNLSENSFEIINEDDSVNFCKKPIGRNNTVINKSEHTNSEMHGYPLSPPRKVQIDNQHNTYGRKMSHIIENDKDDIDNMQLSQRSQNYNTPREVSINSNNVTISSNKNNNNLTKNNNEGNGSQENITKYHDSIEHETTSSKEEIDYGNDNTEIKSRSSSPTLQQSIQIVRPSSPILQPYPPNSPIRVSTVVSTVVSPRAKINKRTSTQNLTDERNEIFLNQFTSEQQNRSDNSDKSIDKILLIKEYNKLDKYISILKIEIDNKRELIDNLKNKNSSLKTILEMEINQTQQKIQNITNLLLITYNKQISTPKQISSSKQSKQTLNPIDPGSVVNSQNQLALLQAKHNDLNKRLKDCDKNVEIEEKALLEIMNNFDQEILKKNNIEERLNDMGIKKEDILSFKTEAETYV